jgi:hypothetical protein
MLRELEAAEGADLALAGRYIAIVNAHIDPLRKIAGDIEFVREANMTRTLAEIDEDIDSNRSELIARCPTLRRTLASTEEWQRAWNSHPDLLAIGRALFNERYDALNPTPEEPT